MRKTFILAIGFILPFQIFAEQWVKRYNGPKNSIDIVNAIALDKKGNIYITGMSEVSRKHSFYVTIKYNNSGEEQWITIYGDSSTNYCKNTAVGIAVDDSGNVYVTGNSKISDSTSRDYATIKYDSMGNTVWVKRYDGPGNGTDFARAVVLDKSGNVYVAGSSYDSTTKNDYTIIKYNNSGDTVWVRSYNGPDNDDDFAQAIALDSNENIYITGRSGNFNKDSKSSYLTIKYNNSGNTMWVRRYDVRNNYYDAPSGISIDKNGNIYVTGESWGVEGIKADYDYATIKYDSSGNAMWVRRYNGPAGYEDCAKAIAVDDSCNVYVTGHSCGRGTEFDYATIKYNSSGDTMWVRRYNGRRNTGDFARAIALDKDGNVYVTGQSYGSGYETVKYNSSGEKQWTQSYIGNDDHGYATAIATDDSGNVYVTGHSRGIGTGTDYVTVKYSARETKKRSRKLFFLF